MYKPMGFSNSQNSVRGVFILSFVYALLNWLPLLFVLVIQVACAVILFGTQQFGPKISCTQCKDPELKVKKNLTRMSNVFPSQC